MKIFISIIQIILALFIGFLGIQKVLMPIPDLIEFGMIWIEDFPVWQVRTIGVLETLGALGLIIPFTIKSFPKILVVLAAAGLSLTMVGAVMTHISRGDVITSIIITSILSLMAAAIAVYRFKQYQSEP